MTQTLPQTYTANHATFPIQISAITVQIAVISEAPSNISIIYVFSTIAISV